MTAGHAPALMAELTIGASLDVMARDAARMRGDGPTVFAQVTAGAGVPEIIGHLDAARSLRPSGA